MSSPWCFWKGFSILSSYPGTTPGQALVGAYLYRDTVLDRWWGLKCSLCCFGLFLHTDKAGVQLRALWKIDRDPGWCCMHLKLLPQQTPDTLSCSWNRRKLGRISFLSLSDLEIQIKNENAVREMVRHGILNKTWEEFFSAEIFSLSLWRKMRIVLAEQQGTSAAADCCSPLGCHSGSDVLTMTQISRVPRSDFYTED